MPHPTPQIALDAEARLRAAMLASDVDALDRLLHDDLLFNGPTGETATKAMDLANYRSGGVRLASLDASDETISIIGDLAIVAITVAIRGTYMGAELDGRVRYLRVWRQDGDDLRVVAGSVIPLG